MKLLKWALVGWTVCATVIILLALSSTRTPTTETSVFCAYGRVFVEFDENGKKWGTMMLDFNGRPIPCQDDEEHKTKAENTI